MFTLKNSVRKGLKKVGVNSISDVSLYVHPQHKTLLHRVTRYLRTYGSYPAERALSAMRKHGG